MIYLIKSYLPFGKYVYKIGFTNSLFKRKCHYFYANPGYEMVSVREGDESLEKLLHYYLYYKGFQYRKYGKLDEWFLGDSKVRDIFHYSREKIEKELWRNRDKVFDLKGKLKSSMDYKIFEFLYQKNKDSFVGEEYKVTEDRKVLKTSAKDIDVAFWKMYSPGNIIISPPDIDLDPILEKEIDNFLKNHFHTTGIFENKMKMYCEFMDKHKGNLEVSDILYYKIKDDRFRKYYNFFGTSGCKSRKFREGNLYSDMMNVSKESELSSIIYSRFKVDSKYTLKEIKLTLQDICRDLGITSKPKATDLGKYFKLERIKFSDPKTKKRIEGYLLKPLL